MGGYRGVMRGSITVAAVGLALAASLQAATVVYVKPNGNAGVDGRGGWANATTLANALARQNDAANPVDIWVAQGTYSPDQSDRKNSLVIRSGARLYGGFAGTESALDQRDWRRRLTILDGRNSSYNVVRLSDAANVVLDGFIVQGGRADLGG